MALLKETPQDDVKNCRNCMNCRRRFSQGDLAANITRPRLPGYDGLEDFGTHPLYGRHHFDKHVPDADAFVFESTDEVLSDVGSRAEAFHPVEEEYDGPIALVRPDGLLAPPPAHGQHNRHAC